MITPLVLHEDAFYEYFKPYRHPDACHNIWGGLGLETFGSDFDIVRKLEVSYVWTVLDSDSNNDQWITPGIHFVNRVCYLVTEKPHHGLDFEFRIPSRLNSLTPIGLSRQMNKIARLIHSL
jgi:hypothetical protein